MFAEVLNSLFPLIVDCLEPKRPVEDFPLRDAIAQAVSAMEEVNRPACSAVLELAWPEIESNACNAQPQVRFAGS